LNTYPCEVLYYHHRSVKLPVWKPATMLKKHGNMYICKVACIQGTGSYHATEVRFPLYELVKQRAHSRQIGLYWYCSDFYDSQCSWQYRVLSNSRYKPGLGDAYVDDYLGDTVAVDYYHKLVNKFDPCKDLEL
jgi:hypothetical protein